MDGPPTMKEEPEETLNPFQKHIESIGKPDAIEEAPAQEEEGRPLSFQEPETKQEPEEERASAKEEETEKEVRDSEEEERETEKGPGEPVETNVNEESQPVVPEPTPLEEEDEEEEDLGPHASSDIQKNITQKRKSLSSIDSSFKTEPAKRSKKRNNVWAKSSSRKGGKKGKTNGNLADDTAYITPVPRFPDKIDDSRDLKICLSKIYKAEKVELSEDRLTASSCKGYRMVRATRGVLEGAWYFEIRVLKLGESGHTRLGWSTEKGDLQAPVGYDGNSFAYRDLEGSKVHKALREVYGEEYKEGDVIGFYINLPDGGLYAPKPPHLVWYKGQRYAYAVDPKDDPPKVIPGSEVTFFKNGICQGVAYRDINGGRYYPAASMYTLPNNPNCSVRFNFGPDFECFPQDFGGRPIPRHMIEAPYHGFDVEALEKEPVNENGHSEKRS
ncbi:hypothetical protein AMTRI_Chr13g92270 [Amborella trichopoda]|uniref:B30.2/SPRY domain-containing protein n=1 Tax=Amborella trichopoda TaxID=13333 RepID=U5CWA0_AMBTC|nr:protein TRAUCO [Amborella trichopoda]ERN17586.1 hypothetical protein AMTR_s00059p00148230 [Amborella trichopoda]|eukprot:XP_006856119.1 protein TRAUCO [Amborella trichopoda]